MREARAALTVDRLVSMHGVHEDLVLQSYGRASLTVLLEIALESDFADLFEVRLKQWQRRDDLNTWWVGPLTGRPTRLLLICCCAPRNKQRPPFLAGLVSPRQVVRGLAVHDLVDEAWRLRVPLVRHSHGVERGLHEPVPDRRGDVIAI
jgi:N-terminal domain of (some) glycogen debranching enzymes